MTAGEPDRQIPSPGSRPAQNRSGEADAFGRRIARELASRDSDRSHGRPSWRHAELAAWIRDAGREPELEAGQ